MQGEGKKNFSHILNPQKSVENHKTHKAWLGNLKNARLPRKVALEDYEWKISHHVCEDHFKLDCFKGAFHGRVASLTTEFCLQEISEDRLNLNPNNFIQVV